MSASGRITSEVKPCASVVSSRGEVLLVAGRQTGRFLVVVGAGDSNPTVTLVKVTHPRR